MKVARLFGLVLVAVFTMGAILSSTASAIPKFKLPITKRGFTASSGTSVLRVPSEKDVITCGSSTSPGTILGDDEIDVKITFSGCSLEEGTNGPCTIKSVGATGAVILTTLLRGLLGLIDEEKGAAGILFEPKSGTEFVTLAATAAPCKSIETEVAGKVAGLFSPTGKLQNTAQINLGPTSATGKQQVQLILVLGGLVKPKLTSFGAAESTQEQSANVKFEEAVEVD